VTYFLAALLLFLLFGGSRIAAAGKGLGQGVRQVKRALRESEPPLPPRAEVSVVQHEPSFFPQKVSPALRKTKRSEVLAPVDEACVLLKDALAP
jgi:Sec-independent protein translocase protein TatA